MDPLLRLRGRLRVRFNRWRRTGLGRLVEFGPDWSGRSGAAIWRDASTVHFVSAAVLRNETAQRTGLGQC